MSGSSVRRGREEFFAELGRPVLGLSCFAKATSRPLFYLSWTAGPWDYNSLDN